MSPLDVTELLLNDLTSFRDAYAFGVDPADILHEIYRRIGRVEDNPAWISLMPFEAALAMLAKAAAGKAKGEPKPLLGIPFAVKDNIDVAGLPTTAACPEFSYMPDRHATVVQLLVEAGAIPIGKTNLDQFATGLNGTRSPYGIPTCVYDERYISGGSSSGSAVAVAQKLVPFSLGTDTAGSGRIPAAFNNLVGLKPSKGLLSTAGLVPAARSLDCITIFAHTIDDALTIAEIVGKYDPADPYSRKAPQDALTPRAWPMRFRFGVPSRDQLEFFEDEAALHLFDAAVSRLEAMGGEAIRFDYAPFLHAASLLYSGPWLAERLAALDLFAQDHEDALNPVVRDIIFAARDMSAADAFNGAYELAALTRQAQAVWDEIDVMLLPTAPTIYTVEEMLADPVRLNSNLGIYTNFVNLMDLSAIAIPAGFRPDGLPFGVTLIGRAFEDGKIASLGHAFVDPGLRSIATAEPAVPASATSLETIAIAVVGAHLSGQPLNPQLTERGGILLRTTRTTAGYAFFALAGTVPPKPGLIRDDSAAGLIEVEVWALPAAGFGTFVDEIPAPLGIGTLSLEDGSSVRGFLCEPYALKGADDITHFGGWRAYRASLAASETA